MHNAQTFKSFIGIISAMFPNIKTRNCIHQEQNVYGKRGQQVFIEYLVIVMYVAPEFI